VLSNVVSPSSRNNELNVSAVTNFEIQRDALEQFVGANRQRFSVA
jgi:hypothetical protein